MDKVIFIKQFTYIKNCVDELGKIWDNSLGTYLDFQYHYPAYILSCILLKDYTKLDKVISFHLNLHNDVKIVSSEFNNFFYLLSSLYDDGKVLLKYNLQKEIIHRNNLSKVNNNFRVLRLLNIYLDGIVFNKTPYIDGGGYSSKFMIDEKEFLKKIVFDDGFISDTPINNGIFKNDGIPHLAYHSKVLFCIGLIAFYDNDKLFFKLFFKALKSFLDICPVNYFSFYGRSTNSLYSYANVFGVFVLAFKFTNKIYFKNLASSILDYISSFQINSGFIPINLNKNYKNRPSFDGYMYNIVYNTYFNSIGLFSLSLLNKGENLNYDFSFTKSNDIRIFKNSGFIVYNSENVSYCFNYRGHQNSKNIT